MVSLPNWKYQRLFTTFSTDGIKKFKSSSTNFWLVNDPHRMRVVADWNNMEASLVCLFNDKSFLPTCMILLSVTLSSNQIQI